MAAIRKENLSNSNEFILRELIQDITINDDDWRCIVTMLVETTKNQTDFTSILSQVCEKGYRKAIFSINRNKIFDIFRTPSKPDEYSNEFKTKSQSATKVSLLTQKIRQYARDVIQNQANTNCDLPHYFEAALIKLMIYEVRLKQLARSTVEFEAQAERDWEFLAMQQQPEMVLKTITVPRANSRLKRRDEEWKNTIYIDDAPEDGPNLYILLTGFRDPGLPMELVKIGVPLSCIFRLENVQHADDLQTSNTSLIDLEMTDSSSCCSDSRQSGRIISNSISVNQVDFWDNFDMSCCSNIAIRSYCPASLKIDDNDLYDNISYMLYDFHDMMQDHIRYLHNMKLYQVYDPKPERQEFTSYNEFMSLIPEESTSVSVILEALLRQIEENFKTNNDPAIKERLEQVDRQNDVDVQLTSFSSTSKQKSAKPSEAHTVIVDTPSICTDATSLSKANSAAFTRLTEKLRLLNLKHEFISQENESSQESVPEIELILYGGSLRLNTCYTNDEVNKEFLVTRSDVQTKTKSKFRELESYQVQLIEDPKISKAWCQTNRNEIENCKTHLPGIFECCEKEGLDHCSTKHLLNITGLKNMVESYFTNSSYSEKNSLNIRHEKSEKDQNCSEIDSIVKTNSYKENTEFSQENTRKQNNFKKKMKENIISLNNKGISASTSNSNCYCFLLNNSEPVVKEQLYKSLRRVRSLEPSVNRSNVNSRHFSLKKSTSNMSSAFINTRTNQFLQSFECCSDLFNLIDIRNRLGLPSVVKQWTKSLEEFGEAEILTPIAFLQLVRDCFQEYEDGGFVAKHFTPTDSILVLFYDKSREPGEIIEQHITCVLRTAVCLRDFCDYVADEESKWLQSQRKSRDGNVILDRYRNMQTDPNEKSVAGSIFRDEDFILLNSLKANDLELLNEKRKDSSNIVRQSKKELKGIVQIKSVMTQTASAEAKRFPISVTSSEIITKKVSKQKQFADGDKILSSTAFSSSGSSETNELLIPSVTPTTFDFMGYDLGENRRVQVSNRNWTFEATDGVRVRLTREKWLLGINKNQKLTSVQLMIPDNHNQQLRYHESQAKDEFTSIFHLTMASGIILAFSRVKSTSDNAKLNELLYEIQISWPSGLIIKPVEYEDADFPFYILQYYLKKGFECQAIKNETHRKYLHNGDVVKFFIDGSVIILRPNGTIITIINIENGDEKSISKAEGCGDSLSEDTGLLQQDTSVSNQSTHESTCFCFELSPLRYTVLESDGRYYEVFDGRIVHEFNRLRTRIMEAYSNEEKFVRRADGTDMLITNDGELIVSFPDGTRTLSGCLVENDLLHCEWSDEELQRYFDREKPEGFVSVVTYSHAQHPNYATVFRESPSVGVCGLSMGKRGPRLRLEPHGFGELSVDNKFQLKFDQNEVLLTRQACDCHGSTSCATFHLIDRPQVLEQSSVLLTFRENINCMIVRRNDEGFSKIKNTKVLSCNCQRNNVRKLRFRIFALERNGGAYEYHHHSKWQKYQETMAEDDRSSLIRFANDWLALEPAKVIPDDSRNLHIDHEIPEVKPSAKYRPKLDENDDGIWDKPFKDTEEQPIRFFIARFFKDIVRPGEKSLKNVQKALIRYWQEIATGVRKATYVNKDKMMVCECQDEIVSRMKDIALGKVKTIDWKIYKTGRQYLKELKVQRDEERTRRIISCSYSKNWI